MKERKSDLDVQEKTLVRRLAELKESEEGTLIGLEGNVLDFANHHVVFQGQDLNLSRVSSRDFYEMNYFGELIAALIKTQREAIITRHFTDHPEKYNGFLLTDRSRDVHPVGHIYSLKHFNLESEKYVIQPIYVTVHPEYQRQGFSKVLRQILLYDALVRQPDSANCEELFVIPYAEAREKIFPFFQKLDSELRESSHSIPKSDYSLNPDTVRANLYRRFQELKMKVVG